MEPKDKNRVEKWLDSALKQHGEAEPRTGLEVRVLASLQAESERPPERWNWRPAMAAVVVMIVVGAAIFFVRGRGVEPEQAANSKTVPANEVRPSFPLPAAGVAASAYVSPKRLMRTHRLDPSRLAVVAAEAEPKLEQFPSPQPLSEQERTLASYVAQFPDQAVLVAKAQAEIQKQDELEMQRDSSESAGTQTSE